MSSLRLAVVGSRTFEDEALCARVLDAVLKKHQVQCVVTGGARGADALAAEWARARGIPVRVFEADWKRSGPAAGPRRNARVVEAADALVAFWDGRSPGTADVLTRAQWRRLPVHVVRFDRIPAPARPAAGFVADDIGADQPTVEEIAIERGERDEAMTYRETREQEETADEAARRWLEHDRPPKTAIVKRGPDVGPPVDKETGERVERRRGLPLPAAKTWAIEGEVADVFPPSKRTGAVLVVLVDGRRVILPKAHRGAVTRGGPRDRERQVLRIKGWVKETDGREVREDGKRDQVVLVGTYAQVVECWIPRYPRRAANPEGAVKAARWWAAEERAARGAAAA